MIGIDLSLIALVEAFCHRLTQGRDTFGRRVTMLAITQSLDASLNNMLRGRKIWLANAQIDDIAALIS